MTGCKYCNGSGCEQVAMGHGNIDVIDCSMCGGSGFIQVDEGNGNIGYHDCDCTHRFTYDIDMPVRGKSILAWRFESGMRWVRLIAKMDTLGLDGVA